MEVIRIDLLFTLSLFKAPLDRLLGFLTLSTPHESTEPEVAVLTMDRELVGGDSPKSVPPDLLLVPIDRLLSLSRPALLERSFSRFEELATVLERL